MLGISSIATAAACHTLSKDREEAHHGLKQGAVYEAEEGALRLVKGESSSKAKIQVVQWEYGYCPGKPSSFVVDSCMAGLVFFYCVYLGS